MTLREEVDQERKRIIEERNKNIVKSKLRIDRIFANCKIKEKINDKISNEKDDLVKRLARNTNKYYDIKIFFRLLTRKNISNEFANKKLKEIFAEIEDEYDNYIVINFKQNNSIICPMTVGYKAKMTISWTIQQKPIFDEIFNQISDESSSQISDEISDDINNSTSSHSYSSSN